MLRASALLVFLFSYSLAFGQAPVFKSTLPVPFTFTNISSNTDVDRKDATTPLPTNTIILPRTQQEQYHLIMTEVKDFSNQREYKAQLALDAIAEMDESNIKYEFEMAPLSLTRRYHRALDELKKMIEGKVPLDLKRAVFLVESSYDSTLRYEDFNKLVNNAVELVGEKMRHDKTNPSDNTAKVMALFQYMSDTITVYSPSLERNITSYPKTYDFEDFWGRQDYKKTFVSKALKTGSGQCHSLPLLFLILCQEIDADANLAFSPNHSFIKFKDKRGIWHNLELTNGMLASDNFMIQSGYIKAEALQSRIYLEPISLQQTIVQCVNDLALGYIKQFGYDRFVKSATNLSLSNYPTNLTAHQINANYFATLSDMILLQYQQHGWNKEKLEHDQEAMKIITSAHGATKRIEQLGYSDMPPDAYEAWLKSIKTEVNKQQHIREAKGLNGAIHTR